MKHTCTLLATMTAFALVLSGCSKDSESDSASDNTNAAEEQADSTSDDKDDNGSDAAGIDAPINSEDSSGGSSANDEKPFRFASGELPLGTFDPADRDVKGFDPCTKISEEELKQVGLEPSDAQMPPFSGPGATCAVKDPEGFIVELTSVRTKLSNITAFAEEELPTESKVPGAATVITKASSYSMCITAVETISGAFAVRVARMGSDKPVEDLCARSDELLDALYDLG